MLYKVKTKIENGNMKIDSHPNIKDKRKTVYIVMDEKGQTKEVDKKWLVEHIDSVINLGLSGNSLYLKGKIKKESMKSFIPELYSLIEQNLFDVFKKNGFSDIVIDVQSGIESTKADKPGLKRYKISVKNNPYKFKKGYLCLLCDVLYKNNSIVLSLSLVNEADVFKEYANGGTYRKKEVLKTIINRKDFSLKEGIKLVHPEDYGIPCYSNLSYYISNIYNNYKKAFEEKYSGNVYAFRYDDIHYHFIDASDALICITNSIKAFDEFVKENISIIQSYLYASKAKPEIPYTIVAKAENWSFPSAISSVEKAIQLEKKGYRIVVDDEEMSAEDFRLKCKKDTRTSGSYVVKFYNSVSEYVDKKNKIFYCKLGNLCTEDLWC